MAEKLMWGTALLMYGLAAVLLWNFHWSFWVAVGLGTVAATIGNSLRAPDLGAGNARHPRGNAPAH